MESIGEYKLDSRLYENAVVALDNFANTGPLSAHTNEQAGNLNDVFNDFLCNFLNKTRDVVYFNGLDEKLKSLRIKKMPLLFSILLGVQGYYNISTHEIKVSLPISDCIYHELFHAFSSFKVDGEMYGSGFWLYNKHGDIGLMLNEGYTDLLAFRYFCNSISYGKEANIAQKLEFMVGKQRMEEMYGSNNLLGLVQFLSSYSSFDYAVKFLMILDKFSVHKSICPKDIKIINDVSNYLVELYLNYLLTEYKLGKIDISVLTERLEEFKSHFSDYIFNSDWLKSYYECSSEYEDITNKLSKDYFQKTMKNRPYMHS